MGDCRMEYRPAVCRVGVDVVEKGNRKVIQKFMFHPCTSTVKPSRAAVHSYPRNTTITNPEPRLWCVEYQGAMLLADVLYCPWCGANLRLEAQIGVRPPPPITIHPTCSRCNSRHALGTVCLTRLTPPIRPWDVPEEPSPTPTETISEGTMVAQTLREYQESIVE